MEYQGHVYIPLFIIYSVYVLIVTMVLMSLLTGLAVDDIQVRKKISVLSILDLKKIALPFRRKYDARQICTGQ